MKIYKSITIIIIFITLFAASSCKRSGKEVMEKISSEAVEKTVKEISSEGVEKTLKTLTKKELRSLDWGDLLKIIRKENINLAEALSKLDGSFQKKIARAIKTDYDFYSGLVSSNTILDEFKVFSKEAPKAFDNINVFKYFVKCRDLERRFGVHNALGDLAIKEETGIIKFFKKKDNTLIGEMRDGIFTMAKPFEAGSNLLDNESILKKTLIPNSVYKFKGKNGLTYFYHVDDLGRYSKIEAKGVNANELMSNVVYAKENFNLGSEWNTMLKKVRQTSRGNDINATLIFKYADDGGSPLAVKAEVTANNKKIISESFENLDNISRKIFTTADNSSILDKFASKAGLSAKKKADLLAEMGQDEELAKLIHSNPEFNIKRWLNTRNHVDKSKVARTAKGRLVPNGQVYAGNVYYFNPHLNSGLHARLKNGGYVNLKNFGSLTYEDLLRLDNLYPEGVPFTKEGFPDFMKVAFKDNNGKVLRIDIGKLSGDSKTDIATAEALYRKLGYPEEAGYTWHHVENSSTLIRVPTAVHQLVDHAGGMSTHAIKQVITKAA